MRLKVYVLELSPAGKRTLILGAAMVIVLASTLRADATVPNTFNTGDVLSAQKINQNFGSLDSRLIVVEARIVVNKNGVQYSTGATYCGLSAATTGSLTSGTKTGYAAGKGQCESVCSSATAHMCSADDLVRSAQMGIALAGGWYAAGMVGFSVPTYTSTGPGTATGNDCAGWTSSVNTLAGADFYALSAGGYAPGAVSCDTSKPILCCD